MLTSRLPRLGVDGFTSGQLHDALADNPGLLEPFSGLAGGRVDEDANLFVVGDLVGDGVEEADVGELFVEQRLDHFDRQESRTFFQRYFINRK